MVFYKEKMVSAYIAAYTAENKLIKGFFHCEIVRMIEDGGCIRDS